MQTKLLPFPEALDRLFALAPPLPAETIDINDACGRILATDIIAKLSQPAADLSAMDGYALRFADLPGPLRIVGQSAAGHPLKQTIQPGEAARIFTGAWVPPGADTVAVQEDAVPEGNMVRFPQSGPPHIGAHIRKRGRDFEDGEKIAATGDRLTPARIGLLAAAGAASLSVYRRPHFAILSTGDELVLPGTMPAEGQIIGSNGLMIASLLRQHGAEITDLGQIPDHPGALLNAIGNAASFDAIITIGGASVGDHDLVKPELEKAGAEIDFWRIAIKPGKPLLAGKLGSAVIVGLPGNPVSAFVCARLFLVPLIRQLCGAITPADTPIFARTTKALGPNGARREFLRGTLENSREGLWITAFDQQDSALLSILSQADALLIRPEYAPAEKAGATVPVLMI